jgi:galactokinase
VSQSLHKQVVESFTQAFGRAPTVVARAPGRLEVLGNHTDYNEGFVISCAIDRATWFAAAPLPGREAIVRLAADGREARFHLDQLGTPVRGDWANYVKGIVVELQRRQLPVGGFQACLIGDVPLSAGMSSSAALEMATALALGALNQIVLPKPEWARIGQACENHYVGAKTGLLDQFTSLMGQADQLVYIDFRTLAVENVPVPPGAVFVVANSGVKHDLTIEYNERRQRCEEAAAALARRYPGVRTLRDVTNAQLDAAKADMDIMAWRRAKHIVGENERVHAGRRALAAGDLAAFGQLLRASHLSSISYFENSCPELDILVASGQALPGCYGARLSGGGFGGISIHLVARDQAESYCQRLATAWHSRTGTTLSPMICTIGEGARLHV